ncbi:MAG TPA: GLUG motif-containing protein [Gammaproteobacteria bacterium]|nr:GLUG motif-containing protein [Gammaproteobacteria bacterium]
MPSRFSWIFLSILVALATACGGGGGSGSDDSDNGDPDGDGVVNARDVDDDNDGLIEIASLEQLDWMRNDLDGASLTDNTMNSSSEGCPAAGCNGYELVASLDFDTNGDGNVTSLDDWFDVDGDGQGNGWLPIGETGASFEASFNGNGYTIRNLFIDRPAADTETGGQFVGLFGIVQGTGTRIEIANVVLRDAEVNGDMRTGLLAGQVLGGPVVIRDCDIAGTLTATGNNNGGLAGELFGGVTVQDCAVDAQVSGNGFLGGMIGSAAQFITITRVSAAGAVTNISASGGATGGVIGSLSALDAEMSAVQASNTVAGGDNSGGVVGILNDAILTDASATGTVSGKSRIGGLIGSTQRISETIVLANLSATGDVTGISQTGGLIGRISGPMTVSDCNAQGDVTGGTDTGGLIGHIKDGPNLTQHIEDCFARGAVSASGDNTGGLIGYAEPSTQVFTNHATGAVDGSNNVGGLAGQMQGFISASYATGNVTASGDRAGGLVGLQLRNSILISYATGDVTSSGDFFGGLIGSVNFDSGAIEPINSNIGNSFAVGTVSAAPASTEGSYVGGLIGISYNMNLSNAFATGSVIGADQYVGGLVGDANAGSGITRSFAANVVGGTSDVGALVGFHDSVSYTDNYFASDRGLADALGTNINTPADVNPAGTTGASLASLQAVTAPGDNGLFNTWDDLVWDFGDASQLPGLIYTSGIFRDGNADGVLD